MEPKPQEAYIGDGAILKMPRPRLKMTCPQLSRKILVEWTAENCYTVKAKVFLEWNIRSKISEET